MPNAAIVAPAEVGAAIVSSDRLLRDGVEAILGGKGFAVGPSVSRVYDLASALQAADAIPDILILIGAPLCDSDELCALRAVRDTAPDLRVIVFADEGADPALLRRLIAIGVDALLPANLSAEVLVQSIRLVLLGEGFIFAEYVRRLLERECLLDPSTPNLTPREIELIRFMAEGRSNRTIAEWMNLTEQSVKVQIRRLLRKLGAANRTQAAIWAVERGLVRADEIGAADLA
jgi:two-component system nitrate/nitrite response regulator NarL